MRLPLPIPGPSDVVHAAGSLRDGVAAALALVPRVEGLVQRLEDLLGDVEVLVARVDGIAADAGAVLARTGGLLDSTGATLARANGALDAADVTLGRVDGVAERAASALEAVETTSVRADRAVSGAQGIADRADAMLESYEPLLRSLQPSARRLVESIGEHEVDAGIALLDRLPMVLNHLDEDVIPILGSLERVGPDIHELLEVVEDLRRMLAGIPGMRLLRRRADDDEPVELPDGVRG